MGCPAAEETDELVIRERMVVILRALYWHRLKLTTADVARLVGIRWDSAYETMLLIERITPELRKDTDGWCIEFPQK